ncbi:hypothetical protein RI367_003724 [Sorochytrium milnesiophthora]
MTTTLDHTGLEASALVMSIAVSTFIAATCFAAVKEVLPDFRRSQTAIANVTLATWLLLLVASILRMASIAYDALGMSKTTQLRGCSPWETVDACLGAAITGLAELLVTSAIALSFWAYVQTLKAITSNVDTLHRAPAVLYVVFPAVIAGAVDNLANLAYGRQSALVPAIVPLAAFLVIACVDTLLTVAIQRMLPAHQRRAEASAAQLLSSPTSPSSRTKITSQQSRTLIAHISRSLVLVHALNFLRCGLHIACVIAYTRNTLTSVPALTTTSLWVDFHTMLIILVRYASLAPQQQLPTLLYATNVSPTSERAPLLHSLGAS